MRETRRALLSIVVALAWIPRLATANSGDFSGAVAIGTGYAGISTAPTNSLIVQGVVGIGSTSPITSLDLSQKTDAVALPVGTNGSRPTGAALTNGEIRYNSAIPGVEAYVGSSWTTLLSEGAGGGVLGVANGGTGTATIFTPGSVVFAGMSGIYAQDNAQFFWDDVNHRLGIGTTTPSSDLSFGGATARIISMERAPGTGNNLSLQAGGGLSGGTDENGGNLILSGGVSTGAGSSAINFNIYPAAASGTSDNTALTAMTIAGTGNVGIGSAVPIVSLDLSQKKDAVALPVGSSADRPATATNGEIRYNTSTPGVEAYVAGGWTTLQTSGSSALPSGAIIMWATSSAPAGFLECDGSAVSRTTYAALFAAIGTTFGAGDGSTTFNLPDMRGYFPRGWADTSSVDSGRSFGSTQQDAFQGHLHTAGAEIVGVSVEGGPNSIPSGGNTGSPITDGTNGTPRTASETRPVNVALMFCIKI